ncbi:MAG: riboflavin synthase [Candidatus Cloacimonadota bacterium]|nr:MAG: riboflavin synthase [Candidatus Cloacimonadota bacterium]
MFTGIVEELGKVKFWESDTILRIECKLVLQDLNLGDSIAVNGICLTAIKIGQNYFDANVSLETKNRWAEQNYCVGAKVNLERALQLQTRLGGHLVQGHVDDVAKIISKKKLGDFIEFKVQLNDKLFPYLVEKGSITIDGISLTINALDKTLISLMVVPHTLKKTCLLDRGLNDLVNIEVDIMGKYVLRQISWLKTDSLEDSNISLSSLIKAGFIQ